MNDAVHATAAPKAVGSYPHARRVGNLLFLSGIGPRDPATNAIAGNEYFADGRVRRYDIEAQARAVFANVRAVLEASGARWEDLADVTVSQVLLGRVLPGSGRRALPHHPRHHRPADADRDRAQVHRRAGGLTPCCRTRSTCRRGSTSTGTC